MDTSQYGEDDFRNIKSLVKRIANGFAVNATGPRAGLTSFSTNAELRIPFSDYLTPRKFQSDVDKLSQSGNSRRLDVGISAAYDELFSIKSGARDNVPHVLLLITSGRQSKVLGSHDPRFAAESFHEVGKKIIAVGVGPDVDKKELVSITKDEASVFLVEKSADLAEKKFWKKLTTDACLGTGDKALRNQ